MPWASIQAGRAPAGVLSVTLVIGIDVMTGWGEFTWDESMPLWLEYVVLAVIAAEATRSIRSGTAGRVGRTSDQSAGATRPPR